MEPSDIAEIVFDRVFDYCTRHHDTPLECLANHSPDQLDVFIDAYLTDKDNEINEAIENSDREFWRAIVREYEKLWKERMGAYVGESLGDELKLIAEGIIQNDELSDASKVGYLKAYDKVLDEFGNVVKRALQNSKPLSKHELYDWFMKIADAVSIKNYAYREEVLYFVDFYNMLNNNEKLEALSILLDAIADVLYDIENKYLPDLGVLTNNNS